MQKRQLNNLPLEFNSNIDSEVGWTVDFDAQYSTERKCPSGGGFADVLPPEVLPPEEEVKKLFKVPEEVDKLLDEVLGFVLLDLGLDVGTFLKLIIRENAFSLPLGGGVQLLADDGAFPPNS